MMHRVLSTVAQRSTIDGDQWSGVMQEFGRLVREARERNRITPKDLAAKLCRTDSYVSRLETGKILTPPPEVTSVLARELGVDETRLVRLIGYLSTVPEDSESPRDPSFAPSDPRSRVIALLPMLDDPANAKSAADYIDWLLERSSRGAPMP
jgi:transcriptional regulator with XRE-family HTH domain